MQKIVTGGQTGVDRAALDVALTLNIPCGGWCPQGRRAEDGPIPVRYPLVETPTPQYECRTEWNVRDSDGTLIITRGPLAGGTALTQQLARRYGKPLLVVELEAPPRPAALADWLSRHAIRTLNVAGPRESGRPGIYQQAVDYLMRALPH